MLSSEAFSFARTSALRRFLYPDWSGYVSLCEEPELFSTIKDNPLIVIHPGFRQWWPGEMKETKKYNDFNYESYLRKLRTKVFEVAEEGRTILVYTPVKHREKALETIGSPQGVILIPTTMDGGTVLDVSLLGERAREFHEALVFQISKAEICGEYSHSCIKSVENFLDGIELTRVEDCVFPPSWYHPEFGQ